MRFGSVESKLQKLSCLFNICLYRLRSKKDLSSSCLGKNSVLNGVSCILIRFQVLKILLFLIPRLSNFLGDKIYLRFILYTIKNADMHLCLSSSFLIAVLVFSSLYFQQVLRNLRIYTRKLKRRNR
jgi:hypothetical protein